MHSHRGRMGTSKIFQILMFGDTESTVIHSHRDGGNELITVLLGHIEQNY